MAEKSFPLNNTDYGAEDAQLYFATRTRGVFAGDHLAVTANGDMTVTLGTGIAWLKNGDFGGIVYGNTAPLTLNVPLADATYPRVDRVVIRYDVQTNSVYAYIKQGTAASNAVPPVLQRNALADEISVAKIHVPAAATSLSASNISDERLSADVCGLVSDGESLDTSVIEAQWNAKLAELDALLSQNVAVQLSERIEANEEAIEVNANAINKRLTGVTVFSVLVDKESSPLDTTVQNVFNVTGARPGDWVVLYPHNDYIAAFRTADLLPGKIVSNNQVPIYAKSSPPVKFYMDVYHPKFS